MVQVKLLLLLVAHLVITGLPGAAAALLVARRRAAAQLPLLLGVFLAATGTLAMLTFWVYFASPAVGKVLAPLIVVASVGCTAWVLQVSSAARTATRQLATPIALWMLGTIFLVFFGFVHGGSATPLATGVNRFFGPLVPRDRFSVQLASDSDIPRFFASWFYVHGHSPRPPIFPGDWMFSDRPPLQVGYVLLQQPFGWDGTGLNYQLVGVGLQQLWIIGLWSLLVAVNVGRVTRALTVLTVLVSGFALVNGFFVWPKLLPAAMLLACAALVATPLWPEVRRDPWTGALVGTLLGLAMLGHGSSIFGIIPLLIVAAWRGFPTPRWLIVGAMTGALLLLPWSMYQKYGDPPGNRLTKWMLAGDIGPDSRPTVGTIVDAYSSAGLGGTLHLKAENFVSLTGGAPMTTVASDALDSAESGQLARALEDIRSIIFFYLLPMVGPLVVVPILMTAARVRRAVAGDEWTFALLCLSILGIGVVAWCLLLFGNPFSRTILHQGSYLLPILAFCALTAGLRAAFPRLAIWFLGISAVLSLALYFPELQPPPGTSYIPLAIALCGASLIAFGVVAFRTGERNLKDSHRRVG